MSIVSSLSVAGEPLVLFGCGPFVGLLFGDVARLDHVGEIGLQFANHAGDSLIVHLVEFCGCHGVLRLVDIGILAT